MSKFIGSGKVSLSTQFGSEFAEISNFSLSVLEEDIQEKHVINPSKSVSITMSFENIQWARQVIETKELEGNMTLCARHASWLTSGLD